MQRMVLVLAVLVAASVLVVVATASTTPPARTSTDVFRTILAPEQFLAHGLRSKDARDAVSAGVTATMTFPTFLCGPLKEMKDKMKHVGSKHKESNAAAVYSKKSEQRGCFLAHLSAGEVAAEHTDDPAWSVAHLPPALKIHATVVQYLSFFTKKHEEKASKKATPPKSVSRHAQPRRGGGPAGRKSAPTDKKVEEGAVLTIEFLPGATKRVIADAVAGVLALLASPYELTALQTTFPSSPGLAVLHARLVAAGAALPAAATCALPAHAQISVRRMSVDIANLRGFTHACVLALAQAAALVPSVLRVALAARPQLLNYEARGVVQTGKMGEEAYRAAGITGKGQVCGIADSGLDDLSCFFLDTSGKYHAAITNRSGVVQHDRRKVIQYVGYADGVDDRGGHGTHVAGSVAGKSLSDFTSVDGMAPDAKISFFDIGVLGSEYLKVPELYDIFDAAYDAGARVHTNSWGNDGGIYGSLSLDLDQYLVDHPDFFVLFAGGNTGDQGLRSIIEPGNAKNCLTVGATQMRTIVDDEVLADRTSRLAYFSSLGPTYDGRIKPDVVAPGDFIESAWAGEPSVLAAAANRKWKGSGTCSAHQMSGTSMATPVAAGVALLVREYFMESQHWAAICTNRAHSTCAKGPMEPSGYLLKALFLHSGTPVARYSDALWDDEPTRFPSFELLAQPLDAFQGHGEVRLSNVLPLKNGRGLDPRLNLHVWDDFNLGEGQTVKFEVRVPVSMAGPGGAAAAKGGGALPLKVTVAWYDPPSPVGSLRNLLLQDVDLVVVAPDGYLHWGNANSAGDTEHAADRAAANLRLRGEPLAGNTSMPGWTYADDSNPNEQVYVADTRCAVGDQKDGACVYAIYVHADVLPVKDHQRVAVVVTAPGTVSEPVPTDEWFAAHLRRFNPPPPPKLVSFLGAKINVYAKLAGAEETSVSRYITSCTSLLFLDVSMVFKEGTADDDGGDASPANLELTVVDPYGRAVSVGGADTSVSLAQVSTEWPDAWWRERSGTYKATVQVELAGLMGDGLWTVYVLNAWSASPVVSYDLSVGLKFAGEPRTTKGGSCAPTVSPTPHSTFPPTMSMEPSAAPTVIPAGSAQYVIPIVGVTLACTAVGDIGDGEDGENGLDSVVDVEEQSVVLHRFAFSGVLTAVELSMAAYDAAGKETRGGDVWFLGVVVTDPYGLVVQVGGDEWPEVANRFYARYWPEMWLGRTSGGHRWVSSRDVHAAGLRNVTVIDYPADSFIYAYPGDDDDASARAGKPRAPPRTPWQVELVLAYQWGAKDPVEFNGQVTLHFRDTAVSGVVNAGPSLVTAGAAPRQPRQRKKGASADSERMPSPVVGPAGAVGRARDDTWLQDACFLVLVAAAGMYVMRCNCRCVRGCWVGGDACCPGSSKERTAAVAVVEMPEAAAYGAVAAGAYRIEVRGRPLGAVPTSDTQPLLQGHMHTHPVYPQNEAATADAAEGGKRATYGSISV